MELLEGGQESALDSVHAWARVNGRMASKRTVVERSMMLVEVEELEIREGGGESS